MAEQYAVLAEFYDRLMEDADYGAWVSFYLRCFEAFGVRPEKILDLACGTGNITLPLAECGYDMTGIDQSAEMLCLARKKADDRKIRVCLSEQDIAAFDAGGRYDAAVCAFDGVNYLTSTSDVFSCFSRVYETLAEGGLFLFDVNTPYKYQKILSDNAFVYEYEELFVVWQNEYHEKSRLCDFYLTFFIKDKEKTSVWHRLDELQRQRCYALKTLEKKLAEAGFCRIDKFADTDLSPLAPDSQRCFFVCQKGRKAP